MDPSFNQPYPQNLTSLELMTMLAEEDSSDIKSDLDYYKPLADQMAQQQARALAMQMQLHDQFTHSASNNNSFDINNNKNLYGSNHQTSNTAMNLSSSGGNPHLGHNQGLATSNASNSIFHSSGAHIGSGIFTPPDTPQAPQHHTPPSTTTFHTYKTSQDQFFPQQTAVGFKPEAVPASQKLLNDIQRYQLEQKEKIEQMYQNQRQFMAAPQQTGYNLITTEQQQLKTQIEYELQLLNNLFDTVILDPPELQKLLWLRQDLEVQLKQLDLLIMEITQLVSSPGSTKTCMAALVILKQPFPQVISKNKQLPEDQLQVQLLTSSTLQVQSISQVKAALLCDANQGKGASQKLIDGDTQNLNTNTRIAKFPLKFLSGTKKAPANIRFAMQLMISGAAAPATIESNSSLPLVVITNECQWEGSAGTLLKKEAFSSGQLEITWARFANTLQYHFLKATRQELSRPRRILSNFDLHFLHSKFFNSKNLISQKDFDDFWEWFGKAMQKLRYQRHVGSLWQNGLFYGFMGREDVSAALQNQDPGTFIVRFSERHAGQFAIAYIGTESPARIKHYLVQPNDTAAAKKTLPDFLDERREFTNLLVLSFDSSGRPSFIRSPKEVALEPYCGKKQATAEDPSGYEPL